MDRSAVLLPWQPCRRLRPRPGEATPLLNGSNSKSTARPDAPVPASAAESLPSGPRAPLMAVAAVKGAPTAVCAPSPPSIPAAAEYFAAPRSNSTVYRSATPAMRRWFRGPACQCCFFLGPALHSMGSTRLKTSYFLGKHECMDPKSHALCPGSHPKHHCASSLSISMHQMHNVQKAMARSMGTILPAGSS